MSNQATAYLRKVAVLKSEIASDLKVAANNDDRLAILATFWDVSTADAQTTAVEMASKALQSQLRTAAELAIRELADRAHKTADAIRIELGLAKAVDVTNGGVTVVSPGASANSAKIGVASK